MKMAPLTGQDILNFLVREIGRSRFTIGQPDTYTSYKEVHDALGLQLKADTYGQSLNIQGMGELAEWTLAEQHPAVTGLIIDRKKKRPGNGYYELFGKATSDAAWWHGEVAKALTYNWAPYLGFADPEPPSATPTGCDNEEPPERFAATVTRILRDTELARRVKGVHEYLCQICGETIKLPDGTRYAEAHHIQPLGASHGGLDVIANILCLCPNHHAMLDLGAMPLDLSKLRKHPHHTVEQRFIEYHNSFIWKRSDRSDSGSIANQSRGIEAQSTRFTTTGSPAGQGESGAGVCREQARPGY
jgi:hypothetical protein